MPPYPRFRREVAGRVVEAVGMGEPCLEVYERLGGSGVRVAVSREAQMHPDFEAAMLCAKFAGQLTDLADELDRPELRDLLGFARMVSAELAERYSRG